MAKIFNGKVLFASAMQPTGAQPLDDRVVVQSYSDLVDVTTFGDAKYLGMIVGVVDESKLYMLTNTDVTAEGAWKEIGAGGAVSVETYAEAVALASDENIGQVIYVKTKSSFDADGDGEGAAIEYEAAPYIVIGDKTLQKLAASTASGDIEGDVAELTTKVSGLESTVAAIPETYATKGELQEAIEAIDFTELENAIGSKADASDVADLSTDFEAYKTTNDVAVAANATAIGEVSTNLNSHIGDDTHLSDGERTRWSAAADAIEAFMDTNAVSDAVVNTLKEIQEYITSDASAAAEMTNNIAAAQAKAEEALTAAGTAETNANGYTDTEIGKVNAIVATKLDASDYDTKMAEVDGSISTIENSLGGKVDKVEGSSLVEDTLITKLGNMVEITSVGGDLVFTEGALTVDLSGKVDKVDGMGLSSNDFTNDLKAKLEGIACLLYTSPSPRDRSVSRMPSSA